jgi:ubiquitin-like 1-activating enzyme E1 B
VSNLNRQFLFRKKHVGQPKSVVAREAALAICPEAKIVAHHGNVKDPQFGPEYVRQFAVVLNALDNLDARRHMNRVCLAAQVPLIESGSAGYLGQVQVILGGKTECFECQPKAAPTQYPYCTIHATPTKAIHNVIWAKEFLFRSLFGAAIDEDEEDRTAAAARQLLLPPHMEEEAKAEERVSFGRLQFHKAFSENIYRLLQLETLWEKRDKPKQLRYTTLLEEQAQEAQPATLLMAEQRLVGAAETARRFVESCNRLLERKQKASSLDWDKDDEDALEFVFAAANLRSLCYGIEQLSRFDVKQKAGNIIAAIATTNAIIAGLIVLEALKVVNGEIEACRFTYLFKEPNPSGKLLNALKLDEKNPACFVCSQNFVTLEVTGGFTLGDLKSDVLKGVFSMSSPNIVRGDAVLYEAPMQEGEADEMAGQLRKTCAQLGLVTGSTVEATDNFNASFTLSIAIKLVPHLSAFSDELGEKVDVKWRIAGPNDEAAEPQEKRLKN